MIMFLKTYTFFFRREHQMLYLLWVVISILFQVSPTPKVDL